VSTLYTSTCKGKIKIVQYKGEYYSTWKTVLYRSNRNLSK